jgi:ATP adenylyltransferase/5',5'''-P-1,P-4-tetraphosphate phosphorylase II
VEDFWATLRILKNFGDNYLAFYNWGLAAGSSQPYKHVQIIPKPAASEFTLWPDLCVIPHWESGADGNLGANSMGVMGIIWVVSEDERYAWDRLGHIEYLQRLGYPSR